MSASALHCSDSCALARALGLPPAPSSTSAAAAASAAASRRSREVATPSWRSSCGRGGEGGQRVRDLEDLEQVRVQLCERVRRGVCTVLRAMALQSVPLQLAMLARQQPTAPGRFAVLC